MTVDFDSKLFDIEDADKSNPFGTPGACTPIWDSDANKWQWTSALGECGMIVGTSVDTHKYVLISRLLISILNGIMRFLIFSQNRNGFLFSLKF